MPEVCRSLAFFASISSSDFCSTDFCETDFLICCSFALGFQRQLSFFWFPVTAVLDSVNPLKFLDTSAEFHRVGVFDTTRSHRLVLSHLLIVRNSMPCVSHLFNSFGRGREAFFLGVMRWVAFNIPMLFLLHHFFGMYGIVWSQLAADILTVSLSVVVYRRYMTKNHLYA